MIAIRMTRRHYSMRNQQEEEKERDDQLLLLACRDPQRSPDAVAVSGVGMVPFRMLNNGEQRGTNVAGRKPNADRKRSKSMGKNSKRNDEERKHGVKEMTGQRGATYC
jgi:hypothetical protein